MPHPNPYEFSEEECNMMLPHDRFIMTEKLVLGIGRGFDFINARTGRNRDTTVYYVSAENAKKVLDHYAHWKRKPLEINGK